MSTYLNAAGLTPFLDQLGFNLVGYGCTTCIGNSGPLSSDIAAIIDEAKLDVAAVLSGNRNFEGRIHPQAKLSFLASPLLVVAYALAGTVLIDFDQDPIGIDSHGTPVYLKDLWPSNDEIQRCLMASLTETMFQDQYASVFQGDPLWTMIQPIASETYAWKSKSSYIQQPPYFQDFTEEIPSIGPIENAQLLALLGDSITTDHISPAGAIKLTSPAGEYLQTIGVEPSEFNAYGTRRGNHQVMMRGTFANIRLHNELVPQKQGGYTLDASGKETSIYTAAMAYQALGVPLVIIAGKEYGTGSSRDWAAKGTRLLGVKAVIAESFERIHRSNLVGMGVLPLTFLDSVTRKTLQLKGTERFTIDGVSDLSQPQSTLQLTITYEDGAVQTVPVLCRLDTETELDYYRHGGILPYVLRTRMM